MKKGDKIVCVRSDAEYLTSGKTYMIDAIGEPKFFDNDDVIYIWDDRNQIDWYYKSRFVLEKKVIRKQKFQRINEKT